MEYKTLMVHLELNGDNEGVLNIAGDRAERFKAKVIGIAAAQPVKILYDEFCTAGEIMAEDRAEIDKELGPVPPAIDTSDMDAGVLRSELAKSHCGLLVAGAFSHNRMREWIFGGMTQDALPDPDFCVLLSNRFARGL